MASDDRPDGDDPILRGLHMAHEMSRYNTAMDSLRRAHEDSRARAERDED